MQAVRSPSHLSRKKIQAYSYGLGDIIGRGYSSTVYRGREDESGREVAVKVIDLKLLKNDINRILLQSQIDTLHELQGLSHILLLYDVYTTRNNTYLITQLCEHDLAHLIKTNPLPWDQVCLYMHQILKGYMHLAQRNIVHRDLKPANILLVGGVVRIADFGFAVKEDHKQSKYNVGSPLYMAPQSLKKNQYSSKSDVWALGVICFEIITGQTPWKAKSQKELIGKIQTENIEHIISKYSIHKRAKEFILSCLKMDKNVRISHKQLLKYQFNQGNNPLEEKKINIFKMYEHKKNISQNILHARQNISEKKLDPFKKKVNYEPKNLSLQKQQHKYHKQNPQNCPTHRIFSKIIISQIHFCRFLYKILTRSQCLHSSSHAQYISPSLILYFTSLIRGKVQSLLHFPQTNFTKIDHHKQYVKSTECKKLMRIVREYYDRYSSELSEYWHGEGEESALLEVIGAMTVELRGLNTEVEVCGRGDAIILLDYLMTVKQLIGLMQSLNNYQLFARKSRIEETVEGKILSMNRVLYEKIIGKAESMIK